MNTTEKTTSMKYRIIGIILFGGCCVFTISVFSISFYNLIERMSSHASVIEFSKSLMYFAGAGLGTFTLFVLSAFHKRIPLLLESFLNRSLIPSLLLMIIFPHVVGFFVDNFVTNNHYVFCEEVSTNSARYSNYIYTSDIDTCIDLIDDKHKNDKK